MTGPRYRSEPLEHFLEGLAAGTSTPGGGAVAALAAAMAAGLVAMVARFSTKTMPGAADLAHQADELLRSAAILAEEDARAYEAVKSAYAVPKGTLDRPERLRASLMDATDVPLRVTALAAKIATLASQLQRDGNQNLAGDAVTALILAAAAARSAAVLVACNVALGQLDPSLSARADATAATIARLEPGTRDQAPSPAPHTTLPAPAPHAEKDCIMTHRDSSTVITPAQPDPGTWTIDPAHSSIEIIVRHLVVARVRGRFTDFSGDVIVGETPEDSSVTVEIRTASLDTHQPDRDADLRSANHFDVENHPTALFRSTGVRWKGLGEDFTLDGELTLRGVTHPVTLQAQFGGVVTDPYGSRRVVFSAAGEINREDFGLTWNAPLETGGFMIGKTAHIEIDIEAVNQR